MIGRLDEKWNKMVQWWNDHDSGARAWTTLFATNATITNLTATNITPGTLTGPLNAGGFKITNLANGTASSDAAAYGQLKLIQAPVTATTTTVTNTSSSTFQVTSLSASITPRDTSSRILILVSGQLESDSSGISAFATIARGGVNLGSSNGFMVCRHNATGFAAGQIGQHANYIDAPAATTSQTYAVYVRNSDNATNVAWGVGSMTQSIVLLEVV